MSTITFSRVDNAKFFKTLNKRVNDYFKENKEFDAVIGNNSTSFAYALFELSKIKHEKTITCPVHLRRIVNKQRYFGPDGSRKHCA